MRRYHILSFYHVRPIIFEKTIIKNFYVQVWVSTVSRTRVLRLQMPDATSTWLFGTATAFCSQTIKQVSNSEFWWVFYPDNVFLVDLYYEMFNKLGPGVNVGSYPFPFGIKFSLVSMRKPIFWVARDQASIPRAGVTVNRVLSSKNLWMFFVCKWKLSEKHTFFSRSFKTVISSTNSGKHCLSRKCRTYTFNNFSLAKWDSRNGGDLFGRAKIDTVESCIQLLKIVLLYRGHLHKEFSRDFPIFEGMKKFYYRRSAKKCIKYSFDSRANLKTEHRLCFPTSDCLETWLLPSAPTWSRQYHHESTMVWRKLPS